jgi:AraC family transcriptional regulator
MNNTTQLERYKKLLSYLDVNFKEDVNIEKIEDISHYSYRNINRIFQAIHQETIGKYVKRLRLEKAAQYLKYSQLDISDIGFEVGFEDRAAFSKAFKKRYGLSPSVYRADSESNRESFENKVLSDVNRQKIPFEVTFLPDFEYLFIEYRGDYKDIAAIEEVGNQLYAYAHEKHILNDRSIFMTEIVDDSGISESIHLRYNLAFILETPINFVPDGHYRIKKHKHQKYAKFVYQGPHQGVFEFYDRIYALWMLDVGLELKDLPTLEFYPNYNEHTPPEEMITEIYIPVM